MTSPRASLQNRQSRDLNYIPMTSHAHSHFQSPTVTLAWYFVCVFHRKLRVSGSPQPSADGTCYSNFHQWRHPYLQTPSNWHPCEFSHTFLVCLHQRLLSTLEWYIPVSLYVLWCHKTLTWLRLHLLNVHPLSIIHLPCRKLLRHATSYVCQI